MRIFLIGFMGAGKSFLGKSLAERLEFGFLDLDEMIAEREGKSVPAIFEQAGEPYFRRIEAQLLRETASKNNFVIATGGGTPCFHDNMAWMNEHGLTVYLHAEPSLLMPRLLAEKAKRPLIAALDDGQLENYLRERLAARQHFYELSHLEMTVSATGEHANEALANYLKRFF